jgi:hypothetical protein
MPYDRHEPPDPLAVANLARAALLDHLPKDAILARYESAGGKEVSSGKFANPESSAALAANAFGLFPGAPQLLSLPAGVGAGMTATAVMLEAEMRFPWRGGLHPWLDVAIETQSDLLGVESKRYEPFRDRKKVSFPPTYFQPVWGKAMQGFERMRDYLASGHMTFSTLDAAQLVKHAFGLRTQAVRRGKKAVLLYLYAEPKAYPDGRVVSATLVARHRQEVKIFADAVAAFDNDVAFAALCYAELLECWMHNPDDSVQAHAAAILGRFDI